MPARGTFTRFPHDRRTCHAGRPESVTVILLKQEEKNFLQKKKDLGMVCHTLPLKKVKKQGEMPLPSLGPITLRNVEFRDGMGPSYGRYGQVQVGRNSS